MFSRFSSLIICSTVDGLHHRIRDCRIAVFYNCGVCGEYSGGAAVSSFLFYSSKQPSVLFVSAAYQIFQHLILILSSSPSSAPDPLQLSN